jgi:membrane-bound ClpP family serine protease
MVKKVKSGEHQHRWWCCCHDDNTITWGIILLLIGIWFLLGDLDIIRFKIGFWTVVLIVSGILLVVKGKNKY